MASLEALQQIREQRQQQAPQQPGRAAAGGDDRVSRIAQIRAARNAPEEPSTFERFAQGSNVALANLMGVPLDVAKTVMQAPGPRLTARALGLGDRFDQVMQEVGVDPAESGAQNIIDAFANAGLMRPAEADQPPEGAAGMAGQVFGEGAAMAAGGQGILARMAPAVRRTVPLEGIIGGARQTAEEMGQRIIERPLRSAGTEVSAAAGAGAGMGVAREQGAGEGGQAAGGLAGGVAGSMLTPTPTFSLLRAGGRAAQKIPVVRKMLGTIKPRETRATERVARAEPGGEDVARTMETEDLLPGLTPAQRSGSQGLLELEKAVLESSDQLRRQGDEQVAGVTQAIRQSMTEIGEDVPFERTSENAAAARGYLNDLLDTRVRAAEARAAERLEAAAPRAGRQAASRVAREEMGKALSDARAQERALYERIPSDAAVPTFHSTRALQEAVSQVGAAQQKDIPQVAKRLLSADSSGFLGETTTIKELRSLQSALGERARQARSGEKWNQARIAENMRNAINEDISRAQGGETVRNAVRDATRFSADLNARFSQGTAGRVLGFARQGGQQVPESMTLAKALSGADTSRAEATRQLRQAVGDNPALEGAVEDYVKNEFMKSAVREGRVNPMRAATFMRNNEEFLNEIPGLRDELTAAIETGNGAQILARRADSIGRRLGDPKVSKAALVIQEPMEQVFRRIETSKNPAQQMQVVANRAKKDQTGQALKGLKSAYVYRLLNRAEEGEFISGAKLEEGLEQTRSMASRLLEPGEIRRLQIAANTAKRLDSARRARGAQEGVIGDVPGAIISLFSRVGAAQLGRIVAGQTGGGTVQTPGIAVSAAKERLGKLVQDPAKRLLIGAITSEDDTLLRELLRGEVHPGRNQRQHLGRLNAYLGSVMMELGIEEEDNAP